MWRRLTREKLYTSVLLLAAAVFLTAAADYSPWHIKHTNCDSEYFRYIARVILNGGMPYIDAVDHKGPVLFLLNTLGYAVKGTLGMWLMEVFAVWAAMLLGVKTAMRAGLKRFAAVAGTLLAMTPYAVLITGSGRCEELALPFQMLALYCFVDYWLSGRIKKGRIYVTGFCFVCTEMLRQNLVALWIPWVLAIIVRLLLEKRGRELAVCMGMFLLGVLSAAAPVYLWLWQGGAIGEYFRIAWGYNLLYAASGTVSPMKVLLMLPVWSPLLLIGLLMNLILLKDREQRTLMGVNLAALLLSVMLVCLPGNEYLHYALMLLPCLVLPFALAMEKLVLPRIPLKAAACCTVAVVLVFGLASILPVCTGENEKENNIVNACLLPWMREGDRLMVFDVDNLYAWNETNTFAPGRFFARLKPWAYDYEAEYIASFTDAMPEYLVISADMQDGQYVPVGGPYFDMIADSYSLLRVHLGKAVMIRTDYYDKSGAKAYIENDL